MTSKNGAGIHVLPARPEGRPTKLKPEVIDAICASLKDGATREHAAKAAGIHRDTLHSWCRDFPDVSDAIAKAEGEMVTTAVGIIAKAAREGNWQAAAWLAERRYPQDFGRRTIVAGDQEQAGMRFTLNIGDAPATEG